MLLNEELERVPATALQAAAISGRNHRTAGLLYHNRFAYKALLPPKLDFVKVADLLARTLGDRLYWRVDSYYTERGKHPDIVYLADDATLAQFRLAFIEGVVIIHYSELDRDERAARRDRITRAAYQRLQADGEVPDLEAIREARAERARIGHTNRRNRMKSDAAYRLRMLAAQQRQGNRTPRKAQEAVEEVVTAEIPSVSMLIPAAILAAYRTVQQALTEAAEPHAVAGKPGKLPKALESYRADVAAVFLQNEITAWVRRHLNADPGPDDVEIDAENGEVMLVCETRAKQTEAETRLQRLGLLIPTVTTGECSEPEDRARLSASTTTTEKRQ